MKLLHVIGRGVLALLMVSFVSFALNLMMPGWTERQGAWWTWAVWGFVILFTFGKEIEQFGKRPKQELTPQTPAPDPVPPQTPAPDPVPPPAKPCQCAPVCRCIPICRCSE